MVIISNSLPLALEPYGNESEHGDVSVIIPAHQAAATIDACLEAVLEAGFAPESVLVIDDGSTDGTGIRAAAHGVRVLRHDRPLGAARARNAGVAATTGVLLVFVDSDVVLHRDARRRILAHFATTPVPDAVFGSYDANPPAPGVVSRYRNLLHHHTHQTSCPEARTFWSGLGAMRRTTFIQAGGFDPAWENIEDVELGLRVVAADGRIWLDRLLMGTHLKRWRFGTMIRTDALGRAVPWTRLLRTGRAVTGDLNTSIEHQLSAATVVFFVMTAFISVFCEVVMLATMGTIFIFIAINRRFLKFLLQQGGLSFLLAAIPIHAAHYAAALFGYALVRSGFVSVRPPEAVEIEVQNISDIGAPNA